jgi:hypothetical protein
VTTSNFYTLNIHIRVVGAVNYEKDYFYTSVTKLYQRIFHENQRRL